MKDIFALLKGLSYTTFGNAEKGEYRISDIAYHSKKAGAHILFVCLCGADSDGHDYAADAYARGTRLFVCQRLLPLPEDAAQFVVDNTRIALSHLSAAFFSHPEEKLRIIGVTGTKGKSTVCEMIYHTLIKSGIPAGLIGTVGAKVGIKTYPTANTTPESYELFRLFSEMVGAGARYAVMEVSSQGVKLERVHGISFFATVLTNLTEDHIGKKEHPNFEDYKRAKMAIFRRTKYAVLNADDPAFAEFSDFTTAKLRSFSLCGVGDMNASDLRPVKTGERFGVSLTVKGERESTSAFVPMPGRVTASNALAALSVCELCGIPVKEASPHLADVFVSGRFEVVKTALHGVTFVIDYAHNGDSLRNALSTLREYQPTRLICLFGAVGERTKNRRREMGFAASELSDFSILTSDNPNTEPPSDILRDIESAMAGANYIAIPDRKAAIEYAVSVAESGDIVLLAGKGHETYQLVDREKLPFSEKEILCRAAALREVPVG